MPTPRKAAPCQPSSWPGDRGGHVWAKDREVVTHDGTRIRYAVRGRSDAPWVVCIAGFLCPDTFWRDIAPELATDHRVILLNHRGTGASTEAGGNEHPPSAAAYTVDRLADDVAAVVDAEQAHDVTAIGHSMGVQVGLQLWRSRPDLVGGLVLTAGGHSSPFDTMYGRDIGSILFPLVSMGLPALPRPVGRTMMRAIELPVIRPAARAMRAVGDHTPWLGMTSYRAHLSRLDHRTAIWTARGMHRFDATPWLHEVDVPTVVMVGTADGWCPVGVAREMAERIPDSHLEVLDGASHTLPLEFPDRVVDQVRRLTEADVSR